MRLLTEGRTHSSLRPKSHEATLLAATAVAATSNSLVATCDHLVVTSESNWRLGILTATKVKYVQLYSPVSGDFMIT